MIRLTFLLRRKPELDLAEFQAYWRQRHGPLVASHAHTLGMLRYVQVHTLEDPINAQMAEARGGMEDPYDGVAEVWWRSKQELLQVLGDEETQDAVAELVEDEAKFIDLPRSPLWLAYEYPQVNPVPEELVARERSSVVKLYYPLRHPADQSEEEAQWYWRTHHGPLIRAGAEAGGILRYLQVHRAETELEEGLREPRGTEVEAYAGHAELWLDRRALGAPTPEGRRGAELAVEDEGRFIDFARSAMWIAKERVFVDYR